MDLSEEGIFGHYVATFDERLRRAHIVVLGAAIATVKDRWPTVELIDRIARLYDVAAAELGAFFGLMLMPCGRAWADVFRSPDDQPFARDWMTADQARAYGMMLTLVEVT